MSMDRFEEWVNGELTYYIELVDNGNGFATATTYDAEGNETDVETVPYSPPPVVVDPAAVLAAVGEKLAAIPATGTSTQVRADLRELGEIIATGLNPAT